MGLAIALVPWPQAWVERRFAGGLFPLTSRLLAPWVGAVPWSLTGALAGAWLVAALLALLTPAGRRWLVRVLLPWSTAALILGFSLVWGLAYRRAPLATILGLAASAPDAAQLASAETQLLTAVRASAASPSPTAADVGEAARCVVAEVRRITGVTVAVPRRVVLLPAGTLLRSGFAGVTSPWLLEPHVDAGLPAVARLATAVHELTHTAGFAREADTDALSVLAGLRCPDPAVRYAVALHGVGLLLAALPVQQRGQLVADLPARAIDDLRAADAAAARYRVGWLERASTTAYGQYLRSRGVAAGMADYGRALTLIVQALAHGAG